MHKAYALSLLALTALGCSTLGAGPAAQRPLKVAARTVEPARPAVLPSAPADTASTAAAASEDEREELMAAALSRLAEQAQTHTPIDPASIDDAWLRAEIQRVMGEFAPEEAAAVEDGLVAEVHRCLSWLSRPGPGREWLSRSLSRMDGYSRTVRGIFEERQLPALLDHVALVESGYQPGARSHAGAAGLWQFMPATGRRYGLTIDKRGDQRLDPVRATLAAREYFLDLLLEFGGGHGALLAIAAYNAGEGRIRGTLHRLQDLRQRSFWSLAERGLLPSETRMYVPMILAVTVASENRQRFGFAAPRPGPLLAVERAPRLEVAAPVEPRRPKVNAVKSLRYLVRPGNSPSSIAEVFGVPPAVVSKAAGGMLRAGEVIVLPLSGWERTSHRVARGDSLEKIAQRHGTTVRAVRVCNGLATSRIRAGDLLAIYRRVASGAVKRST